MFNLQNSGTVVYCDIFVFVYIYILHMRKLCHMHLVYIVQTVATQWRDSDGELLPLVHQLQS